MKKLYLIILIIFLAVPAFALNWVYSDTEPTTIQLQGGTLTPVDIEQVTVDIDGETRQQYRFHYLKFQDAVPDQTQIDQYQAADVDVQRYSKKHPAWLEKLPQTEIADDAASLIQGGVLKADLSEAEWTEIVSQYQAWSAGKLATVGTVYQYENQLYKTIQAHTTQSDWTPGEVPVLFTLSVPPEVIADWTQPPAENPYMTGDKVRFEGQIYQSLIDNNVWSPATYPAGWQVINE